MGWSKVLDKTSVACYNEDEDCSTTENANGIRTSEYAKKDYDAYFYEKNFFGDVTAIYNESGSCVARYAYNAWGEHTITYNSNGIAEMNPIRYRGYYYDTHTGLYYLQSRYYNPAWGRFISADDPSVLALSPDALTDKNLYIYCDNNPVMRVDEEGDAWHILAGAVLGVVGRYVCDVVENVMDGKSGLDILKPHSSLVDYIAAGASGALAASGVGLVGQIAGNAAISLVQETTNQLFDNNPGVNLDAIALNTVGGAICGFIGGSGASVGNSKTAMTLGKQLTKRCFGRGEWAKGIAYYSKNMMNGAGKSIYRELAKGVAKSSIWNFAYGQLLTVVG